MFFPARLALSAAFVLSTSNICHADPAPLSLQVELPASPLPATPNLPIQIEAVTPHRALSLNIEIHHGDVVEVLSEIAMKGNLQVAIKPGIGDEIDAFSLKEGTPEMALKRICELAGLDCELKDGVWFVAPNKTGGASPEKAKIMDEMVFTDVGVEPLLSMIATQFNIPVAIAADVKGKIAFIRLQNKTPRQALNLICLVADLQSEETTDGTFIVAQKQHIVPPDPALKGALPEPTTGKSVAPAHPPIDAFGSGFQWVTRPRTP